MSSLAFLLLGFNLLYALTYFGIILKKTTKDEIKEIKIHIQVLLLLLFIISLITLFIFYIDNILFLVLILLAIPVYILTQKKSKFLYSPFIYLIGLFFINKEIISTYFPLLIIPFIGLLLKRTLYETKVKSEIFYLLFVNFLLLFYFLI